MGKLGRKLTMEFRINRHATDADLGFLAGYLISVIEKEEVLFSYYTKSWKVEEVDD